jgi:hypothetical protein
MIRSAAKELIDWKNNPKRKPLIIQGARQVGKTWLMQEFGKSHFKKIVYINFENSVRLRDMFKDDFDIPRIITMLEIESGQKVTASDTLIILDEIQEADKGLTVLKYFHENAPEYFVIAAGSLLGVSIQENSSFPVGKTDFLTIYPLSFEEFLINSGEGGLWEAISNRKWDVINAFHEKLSNYLRLFYYIGGMPEVVSSFLEEKDFKKVRRIQLNILTAYENDFAKYAPASVVTKIRMVWQTILSQLAKENRKFIYSQIKKGARAKDFEEAINWLVNAGLLLKSHCVSQPAIPLKAHVDFDTFKLFLLDIGLLNAMAELDEQILLEKNQVMKEFKGALTEQFVAQELVRSSSLYYWSSERSIAEVDFLIQKKREIIPIEVKAEENLKAKSLKVFVEKFESKIAFRVSMSPHRKESWLENIPLYAAGTLNSEF